MGGSLMCLPCGLETENLFADSARIKDDSWLRRGPSNADCLVSVLRNDGKPHLLLQKGLKSPVTIPLRHHETLLKMSRHMVYSGGPRAQFLLAESTSRFNIFAVARAPTLHRLFERSSMGCAKMVFEATPLPERLPDRALAPIVVVLCVRMFQGRVSEPTEYTTVVDFWSIR
jgi:hypothetical protein